MVNYKLCQRKECLNLYQWAQYQSKNAVIALKSVTIHKQNHCKIITKKEYKKSLKTNEISIHSHKHHNKIHLEL